MMGLGFVFNPNLSTEQVADLLKTRVEHQRRLADSLSASGDKILAEIKAGNLPPEAMTSFISLASRLFQVAL